MPEKEHAMTDRVDELFERASALPAEDRARLAEAILASLRDESEPLPDGFWDEEIRRRVAEMDAGTARLTDGEKAFARIRQSLR